MKDKDQIKDLFSEKLGNYEAKVNPELWAKIASQVGTTAATTATTGLSLFVKTIIGLSAASAVIISVVVISNYNKPTKEGTTTPRTELLSDNNITQEKEATSQKNLIIEHTTKTESENKEAVVNNPNPAQVSQIDNSTPYLAPKEDVKSTLLTEESRDVIVTEEKVDNVEEKKDTPTVITVEKVEENVEIEEKKDLVEAYQLKTLPNVFSPNGDRVNDHLSIESEGLLDFNIVVLDESYKTVFQSTDPNFKWDGNDLSGSPVSADKNYVYYLTALDKNGNSINRSSTLKIIR